jgi:hypothetical protein
VRLRDLWFAIYDKRELICFDSSDADALRKKQEEKAAKKAAEAAAAAAGAGSASGDAPKKK